MTLLPKENALQEFDWTSGLIRRFYKFDFPGIEDEDAHSRGRWKSTRVGSHAAFIVQLAFMVLVCKRIVN